jgi:hypothetical protein
LPSSQSTTETAIGCKEARRKKPSSCPEDLRTTPHHPVDLVDRTEPPPETALLKWTTATISLGIPDTLQPASTKTSVAREDLCQVWRWRVMLTGGSEANSATYDKSFWEMSNNRRKITKKNK